MLAALNVSKVGLFRGGVLTEFTLELRGGNPPGWGFARKAFSAIWQILHDLGSADEPFSQKGTSFKIAYG